jgi:hypothetical protein
MLIVVDTGLTTTKAAAVVAGHVRSVAFSSSVVRGLVGQQAGGVYCSGKTTASFQIFSVLAKEWGVFPLGAAGFRDRTNLKRRILIEHAMTKLAIEGKTEVILTQPAPIIFAEGEDQTERVRGDEAALLKLPVSAIDPSSGQPITSRWKLANTWPSVEAIWAIYDLAISSQAAALDDLGEFTRSKVAEGSIVAVVDIGATGTRVHYAEWTGELLPSLEIGRYVEIALGTDEAAAQIDRRLVERHGYRDVIDLPTLRTDPTIMVAGAPVDVSDLVAASIEATAASLLESGLAHLREEVERGQVSHVLFVGGGVRILGDAVMGQFPQAKVLVSDRPEQAAVRGLLKARTVPDGGGRS